MEIRRHKTTEIAMRHQHPSTDHLLQAVKALDVINQASIIRRIILLLF